MYGLRFRDQLPPEVAEELDGFVASVKAFMLREHNEDGTHNFEESGVQGTINKLIDGSQDRGQWWKHGPWLLDDPNAGDPNVAALLPPKVSTGTYNDWAPYGIDTAVVIEIEPDGGDVTLTGIKMMDGSRNKRMLLLRNRDSTNSVHLLHQDSGSLSAYRFDLPEDEDVELAPHQNVWLYYDPSRGAWTAAITAQAAGGITGGVAASGAVGSSGFPIATVTITPTNAQMIALGTTAQTVLAAQTGFIIVPLYFFVELSQGNQVFNSGVSCTFRYAGGTPRNLMGGITNGNAINSYHYRSAVPIAPAIAISNERANDRAVELTGTNNNFGTGSTWAVSMIYTLIPNSL